MRLKDALSLQGSIPEMDFREAVLLACDLAALRTERECADLQIEEGIQRRLRAELQTIETQTAIRLLELRTGIGS